MVLNSKTWNCIRRRKEPCERPWPWLFMECSAMALVGVRDFFENVVWSVLKTGSCKTNIVNTVRQIKDWFNCVQIRLYNRCSLCFYNKDRNM